MNLRSIDLNLLVALDALLDEAHVSRAAVRIGLSQPAMSAALQRCRGLFSDELLERGRGTMRLTPKAEALRAPLKSLLADVADLIDPDEVPLADIRQTLRLIMTDFPALYVIGPLQQQLRRSAPGIDLVIQPWHGAEAARSALLDGTTDIAVSVFPGEDEALSKEELFFETYRVAMRPGHPAADAFSLDNWLSYPHILVSGRGDSRTPLDADLARLGRSRRVGLVVPSFGLVPGLLRGSDMIAMLPTRILPHADDLLAFDPPVAVSGFPLHLAWHRRRTGDAGLQHVSTLLTALLREEN